MTTSEIIMAVIAIFHICRWCLKGCPQFENDRADEKHLKSEL